MVTDQQQPSISEVLIVDDDPAMLRLLSMWLQRAGYAVRIATDGQMAISEIEKKCPDFVITDWEMPGMDGIQLCHTIRDMNLMQYVYIIFITVRATQAESVEALETGADDFLAKPVRQNELLARMHAGSRVVELERSLSLLARTDSLTGLMTQRTFFETLDREWERAKRHDRSLSCVILDLDFFKRINDTYGHPAGDSVLKTVAKLLFESCRSTDAVCRYGGEEFCVLLPDTTEQSAATWARRVCEELRDLRIPTPKRDLRVTASFGVAELTEGIPIAEQLVDRADQALLCAKQSGRDRVVCFGELEAETVVDLDDSDQSAKLCEGILARHVMTPIVACLREDETIGQAAEFFLRSRINSTPVVSAEGELVGMLSEMDLMAAMVSLDCWNRPVSEVQKPNVIWYEEDTPIKTIYEFLCRVSIRRVVIAKNNTPTGTISRATLLRWFRNLVISKGHWEMDDEVKQTAEGDPHRSKQRLAMTSRALGELALDLAGQLESGGDDMVPFVVGGASRMQELVYDLLAYSRYANEGNVSGECSAML
ncbi:MAG: diguanylate cyclase [Pirellulales bacterium]|nr:diguanylate cyclase [Pirellulales bacterium]